MTAVPAKPGTGVELRPARDADSELLYRVYASSREQEMGLLPWSNAEKEDFLRMQFGAQHTYYHQAFPYARFDVIEHCGEPVGRLYVDRKAEDIRIIDISLLTAHRGRGIGGALMRGLLTEGDSSVRPVSIHVERNNPALRLYRRLGFQEIEDKGIYLFMRRPAQPLN